MVFRKAFPYYIRAQLSEQLRWLEARVEAQTGIAGELHEYCRRRADLEADYSRALDKLARAAHQRHKDHKHKREQWPLFGTYACWQQVVGATRALARDHAVLAELYGVRLAARLQRAADDATRLHRKCRDIVVERHEEVCASLAETQAACKTHAALAAEWRAAATKLRAAAAQRDRLAKADPPRVKKLKALDKELDKRRTKHCEARTRALRARADYLLCLEAANATLHHYYVDDLSDVIDCMDVGFHGCVSRAMRSHAAADQGRAAALHTSADVLLACVEALDPRVDKQRFLDAHQSAFMLPRRVSYQGIPPDQEDVELAELAGEQVGAVTTADEQSEGLGTELAARLAQLESGARSLRQQCHEHAVALDKAENELRAQMEGSDEWWEVRGLFGRLDDTGSVGGEGGVAPGPPSPHDTPRRPEQEDHYLAKFRDYVCSAGRLARLESKAAVLRGRLVPALAPHAALPPPPPHPDHATTHRRMRSAARGGRGQFAAPLDEHLVATQRELPLVLTSCVRVISAYGARHQGIFRVSGSQVEMQALRAAFERGEDPLAAVCDASDINSVAGLLKLYLRELRPPLLPHTYMDHLLHLAGVERDEQFISRMREFVLGLPRSSMLVLRYLFAFLSHLASFSDENMMDAWNLAICVGPTLLAAPGEVHAQNLLNDLVKRIILHHQEIFPQNLAPHAVYMPYRPDEAEGESVFDDIDTAQAQDDEPIRASVENGGDCIAPAADDDDLSSPYISDEDYGHEVAALAVVFRPVSDKSGGSLPLYHSISSASVSPLSDIVLLPEYSSGNTLVPSLGYSKGKPVGELLESTSSPPPMDALILRRDTSAFSSSLVGIEYLMQGGSMYGEWAIGTHTHRTKHNSRKVWYLTGREAISSNEPSLQRPLESRPLATSALGAVGPAQCRRLAEATPDLVLDLPARAPAATPPAEAELQADTAALGPAPGSPSAPRSPREAPADADSADTFLHHRDTLKKRPQKVSTSADNVSETGSADGSSGGVGGDDAVGATGAEGGSPVPARNTARVAAKFAELTLTGGSKPALAAKPALLRRPTPHPHHAHAHSTAPVPTPAPTPPTTAPQ
ncbi:SLIT-ROBO Rho GTPase-activating protein 1 [Eumeta japonica]|uniref:SLIT-ROBO Rho GTPase-activating protein 1 n=1 Tax=Eumeta variegata TaxID=151549 RepID=A0A4C1ZH73_EUMVA|nr:SLIT-ROBO Rho GTPase-activating protein 1 [Eumeta japonica]